MGASFILIGSTHGFIDDFPKQEEIIRAVKPEYVLSEDLENLSLDSAEKFSAILQKKKISEMTGFKEVERLIRLCSQEKIMLVGIDFENFGFNETLRRKIKNNEALTSAEEQELGEIIARRERKHLDKIREYAKKTTRPIVIILGSWHLREGSLLRRELNDYKLVLPCDKNGKLLVEPPEDKEIKYMETASNGA